VKNAPAAVTQGYSAKPTGIDGMPIEMFRLISQVLETQIDSKPSNL
jgi:hypothetical protein